MIGKVKQRKTELTVNSIFVKCEDLLSNMSLFIGLIDIDILESAYEIAFLLDFVIALNRKALQMNITRKGTTQKMQKSIHGQTCNVKLLASTQGSSSSTVVMFQNKCKFRIVIPTKIDRMTTLQIRKWS